MRKGIWVGAGLAALVFFTLAAYDYTEYNSREAMNVMEPLLNRGKDSYWQKRNRLFQIRKSPFLPKEAEEAGIEPATL